MESFTYMKKDNLNKKTQPSLPNLPRNKSYEQDLSNISFDPNKGNDSNSFIKKLTLRYNNLDNNICSNKI